MQNITPIGRRTDTKLIELNRRWGVQWDDAARLIPFDEYIGEVQQTLRFAPGSSLRVPYFRKYDGWSGLQRNSLVHARLSELPRRSNSAPSTKKKRHPCPSSAYRPHFDLPISKSHLHHDPRLHSLGLLLCVRLLLRRHQPGSI